MRGLLLIASVVIGGLVVLLLSWSITPMRVNLADVLVWAYLQYVLYLCVLAFFMVVAYRIMRAFESIAESVARHVGRSERASGPE